MPADDQNARLAQLRERMRALGLSAFILPKSDELNLEYTPASSDRLGWFTEFTGSAGLAVIGLERATLLTDGRYTEQVRRQADSPAWEHRHISNEPAADWLAEWIGPDDVVGYAPQVHTPNSLSWVRKLAERKGFELRALDEHLVDTIWTDRPPAPQAPIFAYPEALAGQSSADKRAEVAASLSKDDLSAAVLTDPASVAWLLNIRGGDLDNTPFALGVVVLRADGAVLSFIDPIKWSDETRAWVQSGGPVTFHTPDELGEVLGTLEGKVRVDARSASEWLIQRLESGGAKADVGVDPCALPKSCKTEAELDAIRRAHVTDGVALVRFCHWFSNHAPGGYDEWGLVEVLAGFREQSPAYRTPSFATISGFGPSGASPHYTVNPDIALPLEEGNLYLFDSGGQYLEGTTDVTRVLAVGEPTDEMRRRYTQVLKGHLALRHARFPEGVTGPQLDPMARQFLWADGVDYDHGTGHGVGCFLSVHEGPLSISKRQNTVALEPGMVVSNEPGYYKPGHFGIRVENLVAVVVADPQPEGAEKTTLAFEDLTLCPYERALIDLSLLTPDEVAAVDAYHAKVRDTLTPLLSQDVAAWLAEATAPLS